VKVVGGFWVVPIFHTTLIGAVDWPPTARAWALRKRAVGAVVKPGQTLNLVFGVARTTARTGRSDGPSIIYSAGGKTYRWWTTFTFAIVAPNRPAGCSDK